MKKDAVGYEVRSISTPEREPTLNLRVGLALLRGERFDLAVQKLTEIGVARITPLAADRCVVSFPVAADWERRADRLLRVAREASEQSERVTIPRIDAPLSLAAFLGTGQTICLVERAEAPPLAALPLQNAMSLAIGPEGGWSANERAAMGEAQAIEAGLGRLILRAETAAIVSAGTLLQRAWHEL
jgi:16S rRNA (uracil1498-N3)-methyltransferase